MALERLPEGWFAGDGLHPSVDHFVANTLFFRPVWDQSPAHEDKLTFTGFGLSNHRDIPAWSHVVAGEVEQDLREVEVTLHVCIDFGDVTPAHGLVVEHLLG